METVTVKTAGKTYPVLVGGGLLDEVGAYAKERIGVCTAAIVSDDIADRLYGAKLENSLRGAGFKVVRYVFPNGERSKNAETLISILNFLAENKLTRSDAVFALGGGTVGDTAGFAASVYLRGIRFVQVPTTLLAAVDSSVGGKTGIDLPTGKNLAGTFYQPELVICDCGTLNTLPEEQTAGGFAEVIKYAMICDRDMFCRLKSGNMPDIEEIIVRCVRIKRDIVGADERDTGDRQILNFGHTFGHAIEKCSYYTVPHGSAVAAGMAIMTSAAVKKGVCGAECLGELKKILEDFSLPTETLYGEKELFDAVLSDKKRNSDEITLIVPESVGRCVLKKVSLAEAADFLRLGLG